MNPTIYVLEDASGGESTDGATRDTGITPGHQKQHLWDDVPSLDASVSTDAAARVDTLRRFAFLAPLTPGECEALAGRLVAVSIEVGRRVIAEGDTDATAFLLTDGTAEVRTTVPGSNTSRPVAQLGPGDVVGEMALLTGDRRQATVVALTPLRGFRLERPAVEPLLRARPALVEAMADQMADRLVTLRAAQTATNGAEVPMASRAQLRAGLIRRIRRTCSLDRPTIDGAGGDTPVVARGRLLFAFPDATGADVPLHHMQVEVWTGTPTAYAIGAAITAGDGTFVVSVAAGGVPPTDVAELRVLELQQTFTERGEVTETPRVVHLATAAATRTGDGWDFGDIRVPYWEYAPEAITPRTFFLEHGDPPQEHPPGRALVMLQTVGPIERIKQHHLRACRGPGPVPTLEQIQQDYPENLTRRREREAPGVTRGDAWFADRLLNGMSAAVFDRVEGHAGHWRVYHHWNGYAQNGVYALPNVDMRFGPAGDGITPTEIILHVREPGATAPHAPTRRVVARPGDGDRWSQAKRIARTSAALIAELDQHLVSTHLNLEQYAIPAYRHLRRNPIRLLLIPHLRDVALSNRTADSLLLGPAGFLVRGTALTEEGLRQRIRDVLGTLDWKAWRPQRPVCAAHTAAHAGQLFWSVLTEYVDEFLAQHADAIAEHWTEIRRFSDDLVAHSAPAFVCGFLRATVEGRPPEARPWFTTEERMDLAAPRPHVAGVPQAVHPVTQDDAPRPDDWAALAQLCRYVIHHATFKHTWANRQQYDDGGELRYATLGLRYGPDGIFGPESDDAMLPPPAEASESLWIAYMLSHAVYGLIMRNEDRDVHPALREQLARRRHEFAAVGVNIDSFQSRTNI